MANNPPSSEKEIFRKNYAKFCDVLKHEDGLLPYLVEKGIISWDDLDEIKSKNIAEKGPTLLKHISSPLDIDHTQGFYGLLEVMINHGKVDTQEFARKIKYECLSNRGFDDAMPTFDDFSTLLLNCDSSKWTKMADCLNVHKVTQSNISEKLVGDELRDKKAFLLILSSWREKAPMDKKATWRNLRNSLAEFDDIVEQIEKIKAGWSNDGDIDLCDCKKPLALRIRGDQQRSLFKICSQRREKQCKNNHFAWANSLLHPKISNKDLGFVSQEDKEKILEIMLHAKENNTSIKARHSKVLFCGSSRAGKTNFINLLLYKDFVEDHKSTGVAESHQLMATQVTIKPASGEEQHNFEVFDYDTQIKCLNWCLKTGKYNEKSKQSGKDAKDEEITALPANSDEPELEVQQVQETSSVKHEIANVVDTPSGKPPDVWDILTFLDTGGQPEFITMLPALNSSAMVTFIVHSMEGGVEHLSDYVEVYEDGKKGEHPLDYKYNELIKMLFSMRKVKIEQIFEELLVDKDKKSDRKCYLSLVGTKSDLVEHLDEVVELIRKKLKHIITTGERESVLMPVGGEYFVPVTNRGTGNDKRDPMADKFRNCIYDCLQKRDLYHIPIVWLILELEIQRRMQEKNKKIIHFNRIVEICKEFDLIENEENIRLALKFFHHIGVFLYYDSELKNIEDIVITNYQWVFENLTQMVKAANSNVGVFKQLRLNGILKEQAISNIKWKLENVKKEYFLKLLEKLRIICPTKEDGCEYFMPCVLPTCNTEIKQEILEKFGIQCKASHLLMQIVYEKCNGKSTHTDDGCYLFPTGVFCYLINKLLSKNTEFKVRQSSDSSGPCVFNNLITFCDNSRCCYIVLMNELMYLKVELRQLDDKTIIDESVFPKIKSLIKSTLEEACEELKLDVSDVCIAFQRLIDGETKYYRINAGLKNNPLTMYDIETNEPVSLNKSEKVWFSAKQSLKDIEADFKSMVNDVQKEFTDSSVVLDELLMNLKNAFATKNKAVHLFEENMFIDVKSIGALFEILGNFWNLYDHDMLAFLINIADCKKAHKIYTEFIASIDLSAFDLVNHCSDKELPILPGYKALRIKIEKSTCTIKMLERIKMLIVEYYKLEKYAIIIKEITAGSIETTLIGPDLVMVKINNEILFVDFKKKLIGEGVILFNGMSIREDTREGSSNSTNNLNDLKETKIHEEELLYKLDYLIHLTDSKIKEIEKKVLDIDEDKDMINGVQLLLMVVNSSEYYAAMYYFTKKEARILNKDGTIYYIGKWDEIPAALVRQKDSGYNGIGRSNQLTRLSINLFCNLKFIVALGVCGIVETDRSKLGDVVVSDKICGCNDLKITNEIINRSEITEAGDRIRNYLKNNHEQWSFVCTKPECKKYESKACFKPMLSGTPLIASGEYRDKLIRGVNVEAVGVEMEGIGVLQALRELAKRDDIEFIIVKAGCDYANEKKNKEWQPVAAMAAADFLYVQLTKPVVCKEIIGKGQPQSTDERQLQSDGPPTPTKPQSTDERQLQSDGPPTPTKPQSTDKRQSQSDGSPTPVGRRRRCMFC